MAETLRLVVTIVVYLTLLLFGAMVPCQLKETFLAGEWIDAVGRILVLGNSIATGIPQEVQCEARLFVVAGPHEFHAHDVLVECERLLRILHSNHRVVHAVARGFGRGYVFGFIDILLADDLDPVAVWVKCEGYASHSAVGELFLELVPGIFNSFAGCLDVVYANANVAKAFAWILVAVVHCVAVVVLGAIIVGQLDDAFSVGPMGSLRCRLSTIVRQEVEVKLVVWKLELVDLRHAQQLVELERSLRILDP